MCSSGFSITQAPPKLAPGDACPQQVKSPKAAPRLVVTVPCHYEVKCANSGPARRSAKQAGEGQEGGADIWHQGR
jgi:hypothetical protein